MTINVKRQLWLLNIFGAHTLNKELCWFCFCHRSGEHFLAFYCQRFDIISKHFICYYSFSLSPPLRQT